MWGIFPPSQLFFNEGEHPKITLSQVVTVTGMSQNLDVWLLKEGHSDLGFVGSAQLWDPFLSGAIDDITFWATCCNL